MIYIETPCNPKITIQDLSLFGELSQQHPHLLIVVDGTFASAYLQQPLKYGLHISIHSW